MILASGSPRRRELLSQAGYRFEVVRPELEEPTITASDMPPELFAQALAYFKAREVATRHTSPAIVLGADTVVACNDQVMGKASSVDEARQMLYTLSRTRHCVITGVAIIDSETRSFQISHNRSNVPPMSHLQMSF